MQKDLISQLAHMKDAHDECQISATWKDETKHRLFLHMQKSTVPVSKAPSVKDSMRAYIDMFVPQSLIMSMRTLASLVLVVLLGSGGWLASVSASQDSLPGETLYNVKLATEKVQLVMAEATGEKTKTAELHTEFAARRVEEVKQVIEEKKEPEQAKAAIVLMNKAVDNATEAVKALEGEADADMNSVVETQKALMAQTDGMVASLEEALDMLSPEVIDLVDEIILAQENLTEKKLSALQDIILKQTEGRVTLENEEIEEIVIAALATLNERNKKSTEELTKTKKVQEHEEIGEQNSLEEELTEESSTEDVVSEETATTSDHTIDISEESGEEIEIEEGVTVAVSDVEEAQKNVEAQLSEAQGLIDSGQLMEAVEKAKEINTVSTDVEQVVKKAVVKAKVQPVVEISSESNDQISTSTPQESPTSTETGNFSSSTVETVLSTTTPAVEE